MSPRKKTIRKVISPPKIKGFTPYGNEISDQKTSPIYLLYEEYEALRLSDYDHYNHHESSVLMRVSRPTFTRIYASALQKIAEAFVEGKPIAIEGGKVYFDSDWYQCHKCSCYFNNPHKNIEIEACPLCGSQHFSQYIINNDTVKHNTKESKDTCVCIDCGFKQKHEPGKPCSHQVCPKCNSRMRRNRKQDQKINK